MAAWGCWVGLPMVWWLGERPTPLSNVAASAAYLRALAEASPRSASAPSPSAPAASPYPLVRGCAASAIDRYDLQSPCCPSWPRVHESSKSSGQVESCRVKAKVKSCQGNLRAGQARPDQARQGTHEVLVDAAPSPSRLGRGLPDGPQLERVVVAGASSGCVRWAESRGSQHFGSPPATTTCEGVRGWGQRGRAQSSSTAGGRSG